MIYFYYQKSTSYEDEEKICEDFTQGWKLVMMHGVSQLNKGDMKNCVLLCWACRYSCKWGKKLHKCIGLDREYFEEINNESKLFTLFFFIIIVNHCIWFLLQLYIIDHMCRCLSTQTM